jgi:hypothetical protein
LCTSELAHHVAIGVSGCSPGSGALLGAELHGVFNSCNGCQKLSVLYPSRFLVLWGRCSGRLLSFFCPHQILLDLQKPETRLQNAQDRGKWDENTQSKRPVVTAAATAKRATVASLSSQAQQSVPALVKVGILSRKSLQRGRAQFAFVNGSDVVSIRVVLLRLTAVRNDVLESCGAHRRLLTIRFDQHLLIL